MDDYIRKRSQKAINESIDTPTDNRESALMSSGISRTSSASPVKISNVTKKDRMSLETGRLTVIEEVKHDGLELDAQI